VTCQLKELVRAQLACSLLGITYIFVDIQGPGLCHGPPGLCWCSGDYLIVLLLSLCAVCAGDMLSLRPCCHTACGHPACSGASRDMPPGKHVSAALSVQNHAMQNFANGTYQPCMALLLQADVGGSPRGARQRTCCTKQLTGALMRAATGVQMLSSELLAPLQCISTHVTNENLFHLMAWFSPSNLFRSQHGSWGPTRMTPRAFWQLLLGALY